MSIFSFQNSRASIVFIPLKDPNQYILIAEAPLELNVFPSELGER